MGTHKNFSERKTDRGLRRTLSLIEMSSTAPQITKYKFEWARAIANDDWRSIEDQINKGLNVNRGPILHTAIQQKRFVIARKFIENGADVNKENKRGKTPLQILIENHRQNPPRKGKRGRPNGSDRRRRNHNGSGDTSHEARANGIVSSQERILAFGRYLMQEGAKPISGPNEGEDYHLYQEFYKRKTKLAKDDFVRLKKIIDACNVEALENELDSSVTVQCIGPNDQECLGRGLLHLAVLAPCYKIIKLLLKRELIQIVKIKMVRHHCTWYSIRLNIKSVTSTKTKKIFQKRFYAGRILTLEHHVIRRNQEEMMCLSKLAKRYFKLALILFLITPRN